MPSSSNTSSITESQILQSYLLTPSPLPTILPFASFTSLFPSQHRNNTALKSLYHDLQFTRTLTLDDVHQNITRECRKAPALRSKLSRQIASERGVKRKRSISLDGQPIHNHTANPKPDPNNPADAKVEIALDHLTTGSTLPATLSANHTATSLMSAMATATTDLEDEISALDADISDILKHMTETVGSLSDLRYGKFAKTPGVGDGEMERSVLTGLKELEDVCTGQRERIGEEVGS